uniref:winged helix-turn-helix domain-containing protein n=1 Tax=Roseixanthobacter psychrophilus TaxID=3119917 RepID=UPI003D232D32
MRHDGQWSNLSDRDRQFLDRLEADFAFLRAAAQITQSGRASDETNAPEEGISAPIQFGRRTNADKRADVLHMLDERPELSDRDIARRVGVSPQTVNTWRRKKRAVRPNAEQGASCGFS